MAHRRKASGECRRPVSFSQARYTAKNRSTWAVRPNGTGDVTGTHIGWKLTRGVPGLSSPILVGDLLFLCNDKGMATCVEAKTGKMLWQERLGANLSSSPIFVAGRLYFTDEAGRTTILQPKATFDLLATNMLDGTIKASPAVVGKALIVRTETHLYRIEEKK